ncbi:hypothetical protein HYZ98_03820 [Candidatus Peregrinibacteria bacterium]|nr:hypothetical protein [Candidatus Peregrinibacteria bacterium]
MPLTKTEELERLLWKLNFLTGDDMKNILEQCKNVPEEAINNAILVLKEGVKKQDEVLKKIVEKDPQFPKKFDSFMREQVRSVATIHEAAEQKRAEDIFSDQ